MRYLLDTGVISELLSKKPEQKVIDWLDSQDDNAFYLSVITIGEIQKGIEKLAHSKKRNSLEKWLKEDLLFRFSGRIETLNIEVMLTWGKLTENLEKKGRKLPAMDSMIVAMALTGDFCLVTRNEADFAGVEVRLYNPWI
jgi:predicted nucleic acid-binding protein